MSEGVMILGVAGRPVLHSLSPAIFRELFRLTGLKTEGPGAEASYLRVAAGSAAEAVSLFRALGMKGMNLTSPFKEEAAGLVDELKDESRALGAVNCLVPLDGGRVLGANTDPSGALFGIKRLGIEIAGKDCLVIGSGGAGRSAAYALSRAGGRVVVANRTPAKAQAVAAIAGGRAASLSDLAALARNAAVIFSTLVSDVLPDPESWLPVGEGAGRPVVVDADYKTGALAKAARSRGFEVVDGLEWLLGQALPAFELFTGKAAPRVEVADLAASFAAARAEGKRRKIALIGLMGSGKTTAGRALAGLAGLPFFDSDHEIERESGMSIPRIFDAEGEAGFREREARILDRITSEREGCVLSTGGGAPTVARSAEILSSRCLCAWIHVPPELAASRARAATRPLLAGKDSLAVLRELEESRRGAYASCSRLVVGSEGRQSREVAEVINAEIARLS